MKRLYTSQTETGQGAVWKDTGECVLDPESVACCDPFVVVTITGVGCDDFPVDDNNVGSLPTSYGPDVFIDNIGYDQEWQPFYEDLKDGNIVVDEDYPDLWTEMDSFPNLQDIAYTPDCYCQGEGCERPTLATGRPKFPKVTPLPFFWLPEPPFIPPPITVASFNPDGPPVDKSCCPQDDDEVPGIEADITNNVLHMNYRPKPETKQVYRSNDTAVEFTVNNGYPKWCCLKNDTCQDEQGEEYVDRWMHFPRWPQDDVRNPYDPAPIDCDGGDPTGEPLGVIPSVVDIQCNDETGELFVYYMNFVFHDGILHDIQWAVQPPRPGKTNPPPDEPPDNPEDLDLNRDYQNDEVIPGWALNEGELGKDDCGMAAVFAAKPLDACNPACPADPDDACPPEATSSDEVTGTGATEAEAIADVLSEALAAQGGCGGPISFCYVTETGPGAFEAGAVWCCL